MLRLHVVRNVQRAYKGDSDANRSAHPGIVNQLLKFHVARLPVQQVFDQGRQQQMGEEGAPVQGWNRFLCIRLWVHLESFVER